MAERWTCNIVSDPDHFWPTCVRFKRGRVKIIIPIPDEMAIDYLNSFAGIEEDEMAQKMIDLFVLNNEYSAKFDAEVL